MNLVLFVFMFMFFIAIFIFVKSERIVTSKCAIKSKDNLRNGHA